MNTDQKLAEAITSKNNLKRGAKIALVILLFSIAWQFVLIYRTRYELTSPFIPETTIWEINKQSIFKAFVSTISSMVGLMLYFFEKYPLLIILTGLTLIGERYIYI